MMTGIQDQPRRTMVTILMAFVMALVLGSCSAPQTPPQSTSPAADASSGIPLSPAEALVARVRQAVQQLAATSPKPTQQQFRSALMPFAARPLDVEVSVSTTPTGLAVDTIQGAVKAESSCIVSEIREGQVSTVKLPVLSTGLCFVGNQR